MDLSPKYRTVLLLFLHQTMEPKYRTVRGNPRHKVSSYVPLIVYFLCAYSFCICLICLVQAVFFKALNTYFCIFLYWTILLSNHKSYREKVKIKQSSNNIDKNRM